MSTDVSLELKVTEKIFGIALIIIGAFLSYSSLTPPPGDITYFSGIFVAIGLVIAVAGIFLLISRTD